MKRRMIAVMIAAALLLSACGNSESKATEGTTAETTAETAAETTTETAAETTAETAAETTAETAAETTAETTVETTAAATTTAKTEEVPLVGGTVITDTITSEAIAKNIIGDNPERTIYTYLPPAYSESGAGFPVVYFLNGYGDSSGTYARRAMTELNGILEGSDKQFIFVVLDGNNRTGGSFYVNSPSSGNWDDYVSMEVVEYIEGKYNTLKKPESRAIAGMSMGGYGAINVALNHPDIFSSLIVFCPGIYADGNLQEMWDSWNNWGDVKRSYAQAFSPNTDPDKDFGNIPEFSGTEEDNKVLADWESGYGDWARKIGEYAAKEVKLSGIEINYGSNDNFRWIPPGCQFFSEKLTENGIDHELKEFKGGHGFPANAFKDYYVPFLEKYLAFN